MKASGTVWSVAVSPDGRWIATGNSRARAILWNAATHEKVRQFTEHRYPVYDVDISSDGTKLATADYNQVEILSIPSGDRLLPYLSHSNILNVKFSPDGTRFATISTTYGFRIYSTDDGNIIFDSGQYGCASGYPRSSLAWSFDGQQLFVANIGKIICFDLSSSQSSEWSIHEDQSQPSLASNGRFFACAAGSSVSLWDCLSHTQIGSVITHTIPVQCVALSPSGRYLACANGNNITMHDLRDVLSLRRLGHGHNTLIRRQLCAFQLPLIVVSDEAFGLWMQDDPTKTEVLLSAEIASDPSPSHYRLANRALVRTRLKNLAAAIEDAEESLRVQRSPIGHIVMAIALLGQGDREGALRTFDFAFHNCELHDIRFLSLLKSILVFESGNQEDGITRAEDLVTAADNDDDDDATYLYTWVLGVMYLKKGSYGHAIPLIERAKSLAPKGRHCPPLVTISLVFGWSFNGLDGVAQQRLCEALYAEGRAAEATEILLNIIQTSDKEGNAIAGWIADFTKKCAVMLEHAGDDVFGSSKYDEAIAQYSAALSLRPQSPACLLIKRSRARAAKELWEDALQDANEAVKVDPSSPWGYEAKHLALHGAKQYDEAIEAFESMLHNIEQSHDPEIIQLRKNYISPSDAIAATDSIVREICCPFVVIDVTTGRLCDETERMGIFKADQSFKALVSSMTKKVDETRIRPVVKSFFGYVMFSHAWEGKEPSFQDVKLVKSVWDLPFQDVNEVKPVWGLPKTRLNKKLRDFCQESSRLGYNWAWSDTCCIDKSQSATVTLSESLTLMYKWYANSAATLVYLAGVAHPSKPGDLARSFWMTRAWTLQELLSPEVILFYDSEWKPYLGDIGMNHKQSPVIMQELAEAIKIPSGTIVTFSPDDLGVREKLRLASTRNATREEDVAYSLIGIFKSDIRPHYGERSDALGHLLEEIVARTGEVTVLAWSGKPSSYNSCLPASLSVYNETPYNPPLLEGEEMESCIMKLRNKLPRKEARIIYNKIHGLSPARFATRRLHLPCIIFPVRSLDKPCGSNDKLYRAQVSGLGEVEFTTADQLSLNGTQKFVFAHPWIDYIRGLNSGITWGDDSESDPDSDSDEVAPSPTVPARQVDNYTRALEMVARLGQPFNAFLFVQQLNGTYKRVAAEREIVVSGPGTNITSKNIRVKVLEIL
ncbi:hypothetical protein F5J12DRAFT_913670 [Pisolithus orientalis]|uniref:uncharacterized protein n=1 Tax=Pisolithus orientalis TaxID=936130 RepID=UPI0022252819|nr:uncharacterized protein F5J12DRAFT_913670 [Pisolithus orientalis]KAI6004545.1 hypothetical protein F5J12DRAFT_913670 [Pisolithus orientalis]